MDASASSESSVLLDAASEESAAMCSPACAAGQLCVNGACFAPVDAASDVAVDAVSDTASDSVLVAEADVIADVSIADRSTADVAVIDSQADAMIDARADSSAPDVIADARADASCAVGYVLNAGACTPEAPRPLAPLSTSHVTSRRPSLRWALAPGVDGARIELCSDRSCSRVIETLSTIGAAATPTADLPIGPVFWRLRGTIGSAVGSVSGPTWEFFVGARSAPVRTSWGSVLDVNGDGFGDLASTGGPQAYVFHGGPTGLPATPSTSINNPFPSDQDKASSAGDLNGDGYGDLLLATSNFAEVYLGSAGGLGADPIATIPGSSASGCGDFNGDGYGDLAVGVPAGSGSGRVSIYFGRPAGINTNPGVILRSGLGAADQGFADVLAGGGDANGDGRGDVLASIVRFAGGSIVRQSCLYPGGSTTATRCDVDNGWPPESFFVGDFNGDGYSDAVGGGVVVGGSASGAPVPIARLTPARLALTIHAGGFDMDADGLSDVLAAYSDPAGMVGRVWGFRGGRTGDLVLADFEPATEPRDLSVRSLSGSDINNDGFADLAIGEPRWLGDTGSDRIDLFVSAGRPAAQAPSSTLAQPATARPTNFGRSIAQ